MPKKYSRQTQSLIDGASYALRKRLEYERVSHPSASLAEKLYSPVLNKPLLSDATRGCVSKLGGVAKPKER